MFDEFLNKLLNNYNPEELLLIKKSLMYANEKHRGQFRKSGEAYITHPIKVASMLVSLHADAFTVCAALLHDVVEDTDTKKEDIIREFNSDIANLVDGVTKIQVGDDCSKEERKAQYIRKVTTSTLSDVRVIIIKLMDRVHNMQTLMFQSPEKQLKIARETLEIYVPIAYYLGIYNIRFLLEDLSLKYLNSEAYQEILKKREDVLNEGKIILDEMIELIKNESSKHNLDISMVKSTKNIYGIYKRLSNGSNITDINDILRIKVIVPELFDCYKILGIIHSLYKPLNSKFKDYISSPKTNKYQSLHTTVYTGFNYFVQLQIRTKEMNDINQYGILNTWLNGGEKTNITKYLQNNFPFISVLKRINDTYQDDLEFIDKLEHDVLKEKVYITIGNGNTLELPIGSTLCDLGNKLGVSSSRLIVNNEEKEENYVLKSNDYISFTKTKLKNK